MIDSYGINIVAVLSLLTLSTAMDTLFLAFKRPSMNLASSTAFLISVSPKLEVFYIHHRNITDDFHKYCIFDVPDSYY